MSEWQLTAIKHMGRVVTGKTPPKSKQEYFDGEHLFVSPKDLDWDATYITDTRTKITERALEKFPNQVILRNSVMYTSLSFAFGKIGLASQSLLTNQQINSVITNENHHFRFIYYLLRANRPLIFSYNSGIDTPIVPKSVFESIKMPCPPLGIQKKIAAILSTYDDLIENNNKRIGLLEKAAAEIYREWFVRLRFPGWETAVFHKGVPEGWEVNRVDSLGKVITGKTPSKKVPQFYNGPILFIKTPDMHGNLFIHKTAETLSIDGMMSQPSQTIPAKSICTSCIGTGGVVSITTSECQTNQQINSIILNNQKNLEWAFFTLGNLKETIKLFGGTGTTMTNLSKGKFSSLKIIVPDVQFRELYHDIAKNLFSQIETLVLSNTKLKQSRDLLLSRLISGKLPVDELDIQFPPSMTPAKEPPHAQLYL